jgi:hypothetical protein
LRAQKIHAGTVHREPAGSLATLEFVSAGVDRRRRPQAKPISARDRCEFTRASLAARLRFQRSEGSREATGFKHHIEAAVSRPRMQFRAGKRQ